MRFQIPQFVETEVKIIGPFTLKQFIWLAGGGAILFLLFSLFQLTFTFFALGIPAAMLFIAFAFFKINEISLLDYVSYWLAYVFNSKKYVFKKETENQLESDLKIQN